MKFVNFVKFVNLKIRAKPLGNLKTGAIPDRDFFKCSITISDSEVYHFLSRSQEILCAWHLIETKFVNFREILEIREIREY